MLTKYIAKQFEVFARSLLLDNGYPDLPLKLWKVEYASRYYGVGETREVVSVDYDTTYTDNLSLLNGEVSTSHYSASRYYSIVIKAEDVNNPFGVDMHITAQVVYSYTQEEKDLLEAIGKIEIDRQPTERKYLVCG